MYRDIAPEDPEGTHSTYLVECPRCYRAFDRGAIEIRVLDIQECPQADIAIGSLMVATLQALCAEKWTRFEEQSVVPTEELASLFRSAIIAGPATVCAAVDRQAFWSNVQCHGWATVAGSTYSPSAYQPPAFPCCGRELEYCFIARHTFAAHSRKSQQRSLAFQSPGHIRRIESVSTARRNVRACRSE